MKELWVDIKGYEGYYQVSNKGRVKSYERQMHNYLKPSRILKSHSKGNGYLSLSLSSQKIKTKHAYIHRLVAEAFIPNPDNKPQVNHKDFNKKNNIVSNLEWVTEEENRLHYRKSKRAKQTDKKLSDISQRRFDIRVFNYHHKILPLYDYGYTYDEIAKELKIGRDFIIRVLRIHGRIK